MNPCYKLRRIPPVPVCQPANAMSQDPTKSPLQAAFLKHPSTLAPAERAPGEDDNTVYRALLESTKAIPWRIDWATMTFSYIGPQIGQLLGWSPESWKTVNDWAARIHEDDRAAVVDFCVAQSQAGADHEADYRALKSDGSYIWMRDVVHVVRNEHGVEALVGFMFDISERKRMEEQLAQAQRELERLSFTDGLTGIGNRRMFDTAMARAWDAARDAGGPVSVILADIDFFKSYNDYYGHLQGDECLRQVAAVLARAVGKDYFLGRFGGEEFVLVLGNTDADAAVRVAERCRDLLAAAAIPHVRSPYNQCVTASFGVGTIVPTERNDMPGFIHLVDAQLYHAKDNGRNRIAVIDRAGMQGEAFKSYSI
ncbi:PAS domain S-box-containing protein/diguanylate cyclase (GGDEF)-like protein [Cupriavidus plantarum]|nr:PAS domain S-box-containing protein/diguanylate cyclase (GGDEF)-like protein [Cupriavidus plantarum]